MLATDTSTANYWITNPTNTFEDNVAAGSEFYGIWYEIMHGSSGASVGLDFCPPGMQLSASRNIISHSSLRFGLRTFDLFATKFPCSNPKPDTVTGKDPLSPNIESVFSNYLIYKSSEAHIYAEKQGYTTYDNFKMIDSLQFGVRFEDCNGTVEPGCTLKNSMIALSTGPNYEPITAVTVVGTPRTEGMFLDTVDIFNYNAGTTLIEECMTCSNIKTVNTAARIYTYRKIGWINCTGFTKGIKWSSKFKNGAMDSPDGSLCNGLGLSSQYTACSVVFKHKHNV